MKNWEYTFDPVSKAEWIRQITSDLRQKPFESLTSEWWEGEPRWPVLHAEDMDDELVRLPDFLFSKAPQITEQISVSSSSPESVNQAILDALQFGTQSVILQVPSTESIFNSEWIKNVHLDWITFQIEQTGNTGISKDLFINSLPTHSLYRIIRGPSSTPLSAILHTITITTQIAIAALRFVYHFPSTGTWTEKTTASFNALLDDLQQWKEHRLAAPDFFNQCILSIEADQDYFKQIIQTRTLHVLWQNVNQYFSNDPIAFTGGYSETHIEQKKNEKPDLFLIRASMAALAASLAGTGSLCIHPSKDDSIPVFYRRINRNIQHLLELECGIYKGLDPIAGAYSIDFHVKRWVNKIWDGIHFSQ